MSQSIYYLNLHFFSTEFFLRSHWTSRFLINKLCMNTAEDSSHPSWTSRTMHWISLLTTHSSSCSEWISNVQNPHLTPHWSLLKWKTNDLSPLCYCTPLSVGWGNLINIVRLEASLVAKFRSFYSEGRNNDEQLLAVLFTKCITFYGGY